MKVYFVLRSSMIHWLARPPHELHREVAEISDRHLCWKRVIMGKQESEAA